MKTEVKIKPSYGRIKVTGTPTKRKAGYETVTEAIIDLARLGYDRDFNLIDEQDCLVCNKSQLILSPEEFEIDATYRFEGDSDPGDEMIVFAISSKVHNVKGVVVNAYGIYANSESAEIVEKLLKRAKKQAVPKKRHKALVQLSRDHHFGLLLVWKIRQGLRKEVEADRISQYITFFFKEDLQQHFQEEETELFTLLPTGDALVVQALHDHKKLTSLVNKIANHVDNRVLQAEFADTLENHIRFEERVLFNHLQEQLSEEQLESLVSTEDKEPWSIDEQWTDHFWVFNKS